MKSIETWLENHRERFGIDERAKEKSDFRDAARLLVTAAEADGYTVQEVKDGCGGDVETYLLNRQQRSSYQL
jgi:hypothetical protein